MKKVLLFILSFAPSIIVSAQGVDSAFAIVRYTLTHVIDTTQPENPVKQKFALYLGETQSWYKMDIGMVQNLAPSDIKSVTVSGGTVTAVTNSGATVGMPGKFSYASTYFKNPGSGKLTFLTIPAFSDKLFGVEETLNDQNWTITQDTKQIMGMDCQKATARFKGRDYEAWFSSQLPYSNGPWKLGGLPGLIVEVADTKREVVFTMTAFENATGPKTAIAMPDYVIKTSPKEYKQYAEALKRDGAANAGAASAGSGVITVRGVMSAGSVPMNTKPRQFNNPIEKE
jgi:GLPGLI family protein